MTRFGDLFNAFGTEVLEDQFAEAIVYTPLLTGIQRTINAIIDRRENVEVSAWDTGQVLVRSAMISIRDDADEAIGVPVDLVSHGDSVVFDGFTWKVKGRPRQGSSDGWQDLEVVSPKTHEVSAQDARRKLPR